MLISKWTSIGAFQGDLKVDIKVDFKMAFQVESLKGTDLVSCLNDPKRSAIRKKSY